MKTLILIDRNGKEAARIHHQETELPAWLYHAGRSFGFGVGKLNGEVHYYETRPPYKATITAETF